MKLKKIISIIIILTICICSNIAYASFNINTANLYSKGECVALLKNRGISGHITVTKVFYNHNGKEFPAYCMNASLPGVGEHGSYNVTINEAVNNTLVWKVIRNGYPYKTPQQMGLANIDEAYTATKQAVYCVLYDYDKNDFAKYEPIGEAGIRTLNAMKNMVNIARNPNSTGKASNTINIESITKWEIDKLNKNYISKKFKVSAGAEIENYNISINNDKEKQIKITDINGKEISQTQNKEFKIMIPINLLEKDDTFKIHVEGKLKTYPVLYGNSNNSNYQNYALAGEILEGGEGNLTVTYGENISQLKIIKVDESGNKKIKGVEFRILNEKNEVIYNNLKTNENGEIVIDRILPGKYYIEEVGTIDGYEKLKEKLEFSITLNEQLTFTIKNQKAEKKIEREEKESQKTYSAKVNRLPVTGM